MAPVEQNFEQIRPFLSDKADLLQLDNLQAWAESSFERLQGTVRPAQGPGFTASATVISTWATPP